jgi:hypothetical protein
MNPVLRVRCPKCWADRGVRCISLKWARATGASANVGSQRRTEVEDRGSPDDHRLKKSHKERIAKSITSPGARPL